MGCRDTFEEPGASACEGRVGCAILPGRAFRGDGPWGS
jgi:hypothetical protein